MPVSSSSTTPTLPYISPTNSNHVSKVASSLLPALPSSSDLLSITDIDVQRIVAVVNELITKFELLCSIPETIDKRAISMLGSEITDEIKLWNELKTCRDESSIERLHSTVRNLCRFFLHDNEKKEQLKAYNAYSSVPQPSSDNSMLQLLRYTKWLMIEKLTRTAHDEELKKMELEMVLERERKINEDVTQVERELEKAKKERIAEINIKNEAIQKLKDELREIKHNAEDATRKLEYRSRQKEDAERHAFLEKEQKCIEKIEELKSEWLKLGIAHKEEELNLRKKKFKVESEVDAWIQKYDQEMFEKQTEIDDLISIYNEEKQQLNDLQVKYERLQKEYEKILNDRKSAELMQQKLDSDRIKKNKAATKIQAIWRGYLVRKQLKEQKEKKKKGGKSAKKKKK